MKILIALTLFALAAVDLAPDFFLITSTERRQRVAEVAGGGWRELVHTGGWGPHLRPMMRTDRGMWFAVDEATSLVTNLRSLFYRFDGARWLLAGQQEHMPGVQQNCARVYVEPNIWTYGIAPGKTATHLMEAWYRTTEGEQESGTRWLEVNGHPFVLPEGSNYVGAAVSPAGCRMVWYTTVGDHCTNRPGSWSYLYQLEPGGSWQGPVVTPLVTGPFLWVALGYVHLAFKDAHTVSLVGQLVVTHCPGPDYRAAVAEFDISAGENPFFAPLALPGSPQSSSGDIWVDRRTGDTHVIARAVLAGRNAYYYKPGDQPWGGEPAPVAILEDTYRARFTVDAPDGQLYLIQGGVSAPGGVEVRAVSISTL